MLEADLHAADTLARSDSSERDKIIAGSVVGGTVIGTIAVVAVAMAVSAGKKDTAIPGVTERVAIGWNVERADGEVRWGHCSTVAQCTREHRSAAAVNVVQIEKLGATSPMFPDGSLGEDVIVYRVHIRQEGPMGEH